MKQTKRIRKTRPRLVYLGNELDLAVTAHLEITKETFASVSRELWADRIGRPELADTVKMGRPTQSPSVSPPADDSTKSAKGKKPVKGKPSAAKKVPAKKSTKRTAK